MIFKQIQLEPDNKTFSDIMGNGKMYEIPPFQRDYTWTEEQLTELWEDIESMVKNEAQHFMGYIVLESQDGKQFKVIDGQQRLTSLMLITIAVLYQLKKLIEKEEKAEENKKRSEQIHGTYLGVFNTVTLTTSPKLTLNRNNKDHFREIINHGYDVPRQRWLTATNRLLNKALEFFKRKTAAYKSGEELAALLQNIADGLVFTAITVKDELNAYLVFETLNARGVHLSSPDLLKNYLMSVFAKEASAAEIEEIEIAWSKVIEQLGETNFTAFLRSYQGMEDRLRHKKDLYRYIKEKINKPAEVSAYIQRIKKFAPIYAALQNPDDTFWREYSDGKYVECIPSLKTLDLFNIRTPLSLLMVAYDTMEAADFTKLTRWIEVIAIRYNVICNKGAKEQESNYNRIANRLHKGDITLSEIKQALSDVYPVDHEFIGAFSTKAMPSRRSSKKILHLLRKIEKHLSGGQEPSENLSLEHVLPFSPSDEWQEYFGRDLYSEAIDRLGNMGLLSVGQNQDVEQETFEGKKPILEASGIAINRQIATYSAWDMDNLNKHQSWLAKQASSVWRIDYR